MTLPLPVLLVLTILILGPILFILPAGFTRTTAHPTPWQRRRRRVIQILVSPTVYPFWTLFSVGGTFLVTLSVLTRLFPS
jgi:hypothetical protein